MAWRIVAGTRTCIVLRAKEFGSEFISLGGLSLLPARAVALIAPRNEDEFLALRIKGYN